MANDRDGDRRTLAAKTFGRHRKGFDIRLPRVGDGIEIGRADIAFRSVGIGPEPQRRQQLREISRTSLDKPECRDGNPRHQSLVL